jgi:hypothetical protein
MMARKTNGSSHEALVLGGDIVHGDVVNENRTGEKTKLQYANKKREPKLP